MYPRKTKPSTSKPPKLVDSYRHAEKRAKRGTIAAKVIQYWDDVLKVYEAGRE